MGQTIHAKLIRLLYNLPELLLKKKTKKPTTVCGLGLFFIHFVKK
jgi:hypothetical protein